MEFHASTTELVQLLRKGHYGVELSREAWERLITWIDLNTPYHGSWTGILGETRVRPVAQRAQSLRRRFTGMDDLPPSLAVLLPKSSGIATGGLGMAEAEYVLGSTADRTAKRTDPASGTAPISAAYGPVKAVVTRLEQPPSPAVAAPGNLERESPGAREEFRLPLAPGLTIDFVRIPARTFEMGAEDGFPDERPVTPIHIARPFWMAKCEITNAQYRVFAPTHDSGVESMHGYQFGVRGWPVNEPHQPVVRISWNAAMAFCRWLSARTGLAINLPTEAQWEYACRAGTKSPFWFGDIDKDFSRYANMADEKLREFAVDTFVTFRVLQNPGPYDDWIPKDDRFNDGGLVSMPVGSYQPNPWGLHDMHGNVWEWTRSLYRPYPYWADDGREDERADGPRVVRGGSWYDRPNRCRASFRLAYEPYAPVFNVGFRVVIDDPRPGELLTRTRATVNTEN